MKYVITAILILISIGIMLLSFKILPVIFAIGVSILNYIPFRAMVDEGTGKFNPTSNLLMWFVVVVMSLILIAIYKTAF